MIQKSRSQPKKRRRHDADETRGALLWAAEAHFAEHGFASSNVHKIACAADTTGSLVNAYFGGKEGLYVEVQRAIGARARAAMEKELTDPERAPLPADGLLRFLVRYYEQYPTVPRLVTWWILERGSLNSWPGLTESGSFFSAFVEDGQRRGLIRADLRIDLLVSLLSATTIGWSIMRRALPRPGVQTPEEQVRFEAAFLEQTSETFLHGMGSGE